MQEFIFLELLEDFFLDNEKEKEADTNIPPLASIRETIKKFLAQGVLVDICLRYASITLL